jgi:hypothetical protein
MFRFDHKAINLFEEIRDCAKTDRTGCIKKIQVALRLAYTEGQADEVESFKEKLLEERK